MMTQEQERDILRGARQVVHIAGRSYTWHEPDNYQGREMLADVTDIVTSTAGLDASEQMRAAHESGDPEAIAEAQAAMERAAEARPGASLRSLNKMLDMFFRYNAAMESDRRHIKAHATNAEISEAFRVVSQLAAIPFQTGEAEAQKDAANS